MHLIDKHFFPKDYDFYIVNDGIEHRSSLLRTGRHRKRSSAAQHSADIEDRARRRSSTQQSNNEIDSHMSGEGAPEYAAEIKAIRPPHAGPNDKDDIEDLTGAMSALKFVPPSVRFGRGRGRGRGGFSKT
jgi:hypothetical protein